MQILKNKNGYNVNCAAFHWPFVYICMPVRSSYKAYWFTGDLGIKSIEREDRKLIAVIECVH